MNFSLLITIFLCFRLNGAFALSGTRSTAEFNAIRRVPIIRSNNGAVVEVGERINVLTPRIVDVLIQVQSYIFQGNLWNQEQTSVVVCLRSFG